MKARGPRQGKEILLVLSEDTLRPSCLPGNCYLFSENASSRHLLSVDASQTRCPCSCPSHGRGEMEQAAVYCWPRQQCLWPTSDRAEPAPRAEIKTFSALKGHLYLPVNSFL